MAKPNYAFEKRQRELAKKKKKEEKAKERKSDTGAPDEAAPDEASASGTESKPADAAGTGNTPS